MSEFDDLLGNEKHDPKEYDLDILDEDLVKYLQRIYDSDCDDILW